MTSKGVTGKVLTTIISLVLGIIALALLWIFLTKSTTLISLGAQKIITGIKCKIFCQGVVSKIFGGMCTGC